MAQDSTVSVASDPSADGAPEPRRVVLLLEVPEDFLKMVVGVWSEDLFLPDSAGKWARGVAYDKVEQRWLLWEYGPTWRRHPDEDGIGEKWVETGRLPGPCDEGTWHEITPHVAAAAYAAGVIRWGVWGMNHVDGPKLDYCLQVALLGEARYG